MSKFKELINSLKAYTVIIIENEFTLIDDSIKLLAFYCLCNQSILDRINKALIEKGFDERKQSLEELRIAFHQLEQNEKLIEQIPAQDNFEHYLEKIEGTQILKDFDLTKFNKSIEEDFKRIFLKYGALNTYPENQYGEIIKGIKEIPNAEILFFNQTPTAEEYESFIKSIKESISLTNSTFYLCLIDKSLGNGEDSAGKDFAMKDLIQINQQEQLNSVCFIYTSRPTNNNNPPSELNHYYAQEIAKSSPPDFEKITKILAQSAYATVFANICNNFSNSANSSLETVLKNQKNIKYIIDKSHEEGISPYDSIKYWFNLLLQKKNEENEIANYQYFASLSSFFKNDYLDDHIEISEIEKEISDLNNYELFDDFVNLKHLPISPGDIFNINGEYYILIGQFCDTLIRSSKLERNYKVGELIKLNLSDNPIDKKYIIDVKDNKVIKISDFKLDSAKKVVEIEIATHNFKQIEFCVLDLCCLNDSGNSELNTSIKINPDILKILPNYAENYYKDLSIYYGNKSINKLRRIINNIDVYNPLIVSKIDFVRNGATVSYDVKRISRLKGRYLDSLYNNVINYKGRVDLNLIDNTIETARKIALEFSLPHLNGNPLKFTEINIYNSRKKEFIKKQELIKLLPEYKNLLDLCPLEEFSVENGRYYNMEVNSGTVILKFKYNLFGSKFHSRSKFSYNDLFNKQKPLEDDSYIINGATTHKIINGLVVKSFDYHEFEQGINFVEENITIKSFEGTLVKEEK